MGGGGWRAGWARLVSQRARVLVAVCVWMVCLQWMSGPARGVCHVSPPEWSVRCYIDYSGMCCLTYRWIGGQWCKEAVCYDYDTCTWEMFIESWCS